MSSTDSVPTERRSRLSQMPRRRRSLSGISPWVCTAGRVISDSTPPRLSAKEISFSLLRTERASSALYTRKESMPPNPLA